jgi:hypothetical protein
MTRDVRRRKAGQSEEGHEGRGAVQLESEGESVVRGLPALLPVPVTPQGVARHELPQGAAHAREAHEVGRRPHLPAHGREHVDAQYLLEPSYDACNATPAFLAAAATTCLFQLWQRGDRLVFVVVSVSVRSSLHSCLFFLLVCFLSARRRDS